MLIDEWDNKIYVWPDVAQELISIYLTHCLLDCHSDSNTIHLFKGYTLKNNSEKQKYFASYIVLFFYLGILRDFFSTFYPSDPNKSMNCHVFLLIIRK